MLTHRWELCSPRREKGGGRGDRPASEPPSLSACSHVDTKELCGRCRCAGTQTWVR